MDSLYFLVSYDDKNGNMDTEGANKNGVVHFLKTEGFSCAAGYCGCPWFFVDIEKKVFKPGMPGVSYGKVVGDHAIIFDEFRTIYEIYKKYEGLGLLKFDKGRA